MRSLQDEGGGCTKTWPSGKDVNAARPESPGVGFLTAMRRTDDEVVIPVVVQVGHGKAVAETVLGVLAGECDIGRPVFPGV